MCLSRIAGKIPGPARLLSTTRQLSRFLDNPAVCVRDWYEPIAHQWLTTQFRYMGEIRLIVDGTKISFSRQLLIVSLAYHKRAIPAGAAVFLVGDCEFGSIAVLRQLGRWRWFYVLRQKSDNGVWINENRGWQAFASFIQRPGQSLWLGSGYLTFKEIYLIQLLSHWKIGEREPWCLATNLPDRQMALHCYARRMWIEEMYGDFKQHGFDLKRTMLRHFLRLPRLTLAVVILYVWLVSVGTRTIRSGLRNLVDRTDRRDLRFIDKCLTNALPLKISLCPFR